MVGQGSRRTGLEGSIITRRLRIERVDTTQDSVDVFARSPATEIGLDVTPGPEGL